MKRFLFKAAILVLAVTLCFPGSVSAAASPNAANVLKTDVYGRTLTSDFFFWRRTLKGGLEQALYNKIYSSALAYETNIPISFDINEDRVFAVWQAVRLDNPELFWLENYYWFDITPSGLVTNIELAFIMEPAQIPAYRARFDAYADSVLVHAMEYAYDGEKVRFIYDILAEFIEYDLEMVIDQSAYGAIVHRRAVCAGYAMAFTYYMQRLGIPCATVVGMAGGENHAWNLVRLGGIFYNMDVTWDSTTESPTGGLTFDWFVLSDNDFKSHSRDQACKDFPQATGKTDTLKQFMEDLYDFDLSTINYGKAPYPPLQKLEITP